MQLAKLVERCTRLGWRCFLGIIGDNIPELSFMGENTLCILRQGGINDHVGLNGVCSKRVNYAEAHRLLGSEFTNVVLSLHGAGGWPGNLIALSAEYVGRGGVYVLLIPSNLACTRFGEYFIRVVRRSNNYIIVRDNRYEYSFRADRPSSSKNIGTLKTSDRIVKKLASLAATRDQLHAISVLPCFLYSQYYRMLLVTGNRGRGKSSILGLYGAYVLHRRSGRYVVTSRDLVGVQSFFRMLIMGLRRLGYEPVIYRRNGLITAISVKGSSMKYVEPWRIDPSSASKPVFIDEAAGVGVARVRRWYRDIGKIIASSTVHGYEGSGRVLIRYMSSIMTRSMTVKLSTPVRYYSGDPLERLIYDVFHLNAEPVEPGKQLGVGKTVFKKLGIDELLDDYELLRKTYGLLVVAHYRNEPDDLVMLLDTDYFEIYGLMAGQDVVGVVQVREEDPGDEKSALITNVFRLYGVIEDGLKIKRIVRIAVTPPLQRRGLGTRMLRLLEDEYSEEIDIIGAFFSGFDTLFFWLKNDYIPIYISPRYNKVTGEKNIVVVKPLTTKAWDSVSLAAGILMQRIIHSAHILFRDLGSEKIAVILKTLYDHRIKMPSLPSDCVRLKKHIVTKDYHERIVDIIHKYWEKIDPSILDDEENIILTARIIQGRDPSEIAKFTGLKPQLLSKKLDEAVLKVAGYIYSLVCR